MSAIASNRKGSAAKNGKAGHAAKHVNGAQARSGQLAGSLSTPSNKTPSWFTAFAQKTALLAGRPVAFLLAVITIVVWAVTGPVFGYSDTWQLVINTGTTIVTFLMVFLIQNSQNRDSLAFQVKLDELIIKLHGAGNEIAGAEDLCDEDLEALHEAYKKRAAHAHETLEKRRAAR
jgi:low affinity Fe/Cu permease